jgi:UDP-N-acetylmuramate dehydrogenase
VLEIRSSKFENYKAVPNAGSFFKNPILDSAKMETLREKYVDIPCFDNGDGTWKCFAGWFIEQVGWKGKNIGNAYVSASHALILTNPTRNAKAQEIKHLAEMIIKDVEQKFGVTLEREVQYIG